MTPFVPGEVIVYQARRHWLGITLHAGMLLLLSFVPLLILPFIVQYLPLNGIAGMEPLILGSIYLFCAAAWLLFVWVMFFVMWTNYYLDVLIVTNKRLIDREQFLLFSHDEVTIPLEQIEDITIEVKGILAHVLHFGNLQIQTAGAKRETIAEGIMRPERLRACLEDAREKQRRGV